MDKKHIHRYTKIICTLGPASNSESMLAKMASRGMNVVRINASHGDHAQHKQMLELVRKVNEKYGYKIGLLYDLAGYRIRIGKLKKKKTLEKNEVYYIANDDNEEGHHIPFDYEENVKNIKKGSFVFIDDGRLQLRVIGHVGKKLKVKVIQGGVLKQRKGVNIPNLKLSTNIMTEQDSEDLDFAIANGFNFIAQSFVRNRKDVQRVVEMVKPKLPNCKVIAKIENEEGVRNVESIAESCDGVMVARGDLGVTMPLYKIPILQKYIIHHCNQRKKISMTATQMLDSMIEEGRPTRAEVSDVANAILDGTDYVMLSGETAVGKYPSRSIQVMSQIVAYTEKYEIPRPR